MTRILKDTENVHLIEPHIKKYPACFIYDYPKQQSALAQIDGQTAKRFELYIHGIEIANGYQELQSAKDYRERLANELAKRKQLSKTVSSIDVGRSLDVGCSFSSDSLPQ